MLSHDTLNNHLKTNFNLRQHHGWTFTEIDEMVSWERLVYLDFMTQMIRSEEKALKEQEKQQNPFPMRQNR